MATPSPCSVEQIDVFPYFSHTHMYVTVKLHEPACSELSFHSDWIMNEKVWTKKIDPHQVFGTGSSNLHSGVCTVGSAAEQMPLNAAV